MNKTFTLEYSRENIAKYIIMLVTLLTFGCTPNEVQLTQTEPIETVEQPIATVTMTDVPPIIRETSTLTSTQTIQPITATPLAKSPITPTLTPIVELVPTLTIRESQVVLEEFMRTNYGCDLPCWWGIELGQSLASVNQKFNNLGMPWLVTDDSQTVEGDRMEYFNTGYIDEDDTRASYRLKVYTEFYESDEAVNFISIYIDRPISAIGQQEFTRDWRQYYLSEFLQQYGEPSEVYFRIRSVADLMNPPQFSVTSLYLEKGIAITYHLDATWLNEEYTKAEICLPIENLRTLELSLFNPVEYDKWGAYFVPYHDEWYETLTWESELSESVESFYERYQQSDVKGP